MEPAATITGRLVARKVELLRPREGTPLAGRMSALLDGLSHLTAAVWYEEEPTAHDQRFCPRLLEAVAPLVAAGARVLLLSSTWATSTMPISTT